jgi:CRISPR-associated endonuclease/helicase Cas3
MKLLAKSASPESPEGVRLEDHLLAVVAAIGAIERRHPSLPAIAGQPNLFRILRSAALMHDLGKAHPLFQAMLEGGLRFGYRHEVFSLTFRWEDPQLSEDDWRLIRLAVLTHHKDIGEIKERYDIEDAEQGLLPIPDEFLEAGSCLLTPTLFAAAGLAGAAAPAGAPGRAEAASRIQQALSASVRHAHRLKNRRSYNDPATLTGRFLRGALILADHSSSAGKQFVFLNSDQLRPHVARPYGHQSAAATTEGNAILTAPTGSGKTEAALLWAAAQGGGGDAPLLFYVLPYQASLNAMRERLAKHLPENALALQHGKAAQALYLRLVSKHYTPEDARRDSSAERDMGRLQTSAIRILSPYQLLRAAYSLPGHECLSLTPADSLFIFDEIHAYEPARLAMILATLRHFVHDLRARAFIMTATMPSRLRTILSAMLPNVSQLTASQETMAASRRHILKLRSEDLLAEAVQSEILREAEAGKGVLVVANTVARAQAAAEGLAGRTSVPVELIHSRFHTEDRTRKERNLQEDWGVGRKRDVSHGAILVATQVVEVSLDIDFDVLFSDPAPIEAMLQRFGRVNRTPIAGRALKPVHVCIGKPPFRPYSDEEVQKSLAAIQFRDNLPIEESEVQGAIDLVYSGAFGEAWEGAVREGMRNFQESALDNLRPFFSNPELEQQFYDLFDGFEVVPVSLREEFDRRMAYEPLLARQLAVPISGRQFRRLCGAGLVECDKPSHSWIASLPYGSNGLDLSSPKISSRKGV